MDYLRDSILTLFTGLEVEPILKSWCENKYNCINEVDENAIAHKLFEKNMHSASLDHMYVISQTIHTLWMNNRSSEFHIRFSKSTTIFNILLHFSAEALSMTGDRNVRCKFSNILRWHELTSITGEDWLVTSYMAAYDLFNNVSTLPSFDWPPILNVDSPQLNNLIDNKPMVDLHNHLYGSSVNFDLNWLSLMNYANKINWENVLNKVHNPIHQEKIRSLSYKAACIRLYLWSMYNNRLSIDSKTIKSILYKNNDTSAIMSASGILDLIEQARLQAYKFYSHDENNKINHFIAPVVVDYAINKNCVTFNKHNNPNYIYSIFSGERCLMYSIYRDIYNNKTGVESIATLFYSYLLIKNIIRKELVQVNDGVGFGNFEEYERCKKIFIYGHSEYPKLIEQLAISTTLANNPPMRYMETRIAPSSNVPISNQIDCIVNNVSNSLFADVMSIDTWRYDFVYHFIKTKSTPAEINCNIKCRNYFCRQEVRESALKIAKYLQQKKQGGKRVVGIDAANSEMNCRPEVFAQAYRYLRRIPVLEYDSTLKISKSYSIGITYHVGEDNYDVVDGIRSIDEVVRFLEYQPGDRLGHCVVLGIDVNKYYSRCHYTLMMPCYVLLDNIVWLLHEIGRFNCGSLALRQFLKEKYDELFRKIYMNIEVPFLTTYYTSWLLRGDDPYLYINSSQQINNMSADKWDDFAKTKGLEYICARTNIVARRLNRLYHFDGNVKKRGNISEVLKLPQSIQKDWISAVCCVQSKYLLMVERRQFCIECNPTSNKKIGGFEKYVKHPIFRFNHLNKASINGHNINVSINTDDKGIFSTSLEREYALLALAIMKDKNDITFHQILKWLDDVRNNGIIQAFHLPVLKEQNNNYNPNTQEKPTGFFKRLCVHFINMINSWINQ